MRRWFPSMSVININTYIYFNQTVKKNYVNIIFDDY